MHQILDRCSLDTFLLQNLEVSEKVFIFALESVRERACIVLADRNKNIMLNP